MFEVFVDWISGYFWLVVFKFYDISVIFFCLFMFGVLGVVEVDDFVYGCYCIFNSGM